MRSDSMAFGKDRPQGQGATKEEGYRRALHKTLPFLGFKTKLPVPIDLEELYVPLQANIDLRATGDAVFADLREA